MRKLVVSIILSTLAALIIGWIVSYLLIDPDYKDHIRMPWLNTSINMAVFYSLILNTFFFYIRRWDGCIEKLGGALFSFFIYLISAFPIYFILDFYLKNDGLLHQLLIILFFQIAGIGLIATHFLRTKNFNPPKPGEPLKW
jgi:integral membrane sensor domain MASE1